MKNKLFFFTSVFFSLLLVTACQTQQKEAAGLNVQTSILTAGKVVNLESEKLNVPVGWSEFKDAQKLGLSFWYPSAWGNASYKTTSDDDLLGTIAFENSNGYVVYVSAPTYQWEKPELWRYPAFRTVECNPKREDTICELVTVLDKTVGKDTRFSYLENEKRGGIEQVIYFINPKTGYRFAMFTKQFGEYQEGTLAEQLDTLEKFRTMQLNKEWNKDIESVDILLQSIEYHEASEG